MAFERRIQAVWNILLAVSAIAGLLAILYAVDTYFDWKIENKVSDLDFVRKVASQVRPSVIFDSRGSILADTGAMQYLEKITVEFDTVGKKPGKVTVRPKQLMPHPPIITGIDGIFYIPQPLRGPGYEWNYELHSMIARGVQEETKTPYRFRLELVF